MFKATKYLNTLSYEEANKIWWNSLNCVGCFEEVREEVIPLTEAVGRLTVHNIFAKCSVPHYNGSAMDGIAVRAEDTFGVNEANPLNLKIISIDEPWEPGACYIVDTGDLMPDNTNAVIMIENVDINIDKNKGEIIAPAVPWQHVRLIGEDIAINELIMPKFKEIKTSDIAALLAAGYQDVAVVKKPKITIIPTGTELVDSIDKLKAGNILDVNSKMLYTMFNKWGANATCSSIIPDDYNAIRSAVEEALKDSDIVVTNAGTSAGREDFTARVFAELGEVLVHGVAIKPGKPVVLGICKNKPVIGLPGYPVSAVLTAELFIKELISKYTRVCHEEPLTIKAICTRNIPSAIGVDEYIRVAVSKVNEKYKAAPLGRGAGIITSLTKAQGIIKLDSAKEGINIGEEVDVLLMDNKIVKPNLLAIGSHDIALDIFGAHLIEQKGIGLTCANVGSLGGVMAFRSGECHLSGIHLLDDKTGKYNIDYLNKYLKNKEWTLLHFAMREQGIITTKEKINLAQNFDDIIKHKLRFINRQRGSGTRMLLDYILKNKNIHSSNILGYEREVGTHSAIAATIKADSADVGIGIKAAADALDLAFVSVGYEQYDLLVAYDKDSSELKALQSILKSEEFKENITKLGGYRLNQSGDIVAYSDGVNIYEENSFRS